MLSLSRLSPVIIATLSPVITVRLRSPRGYGTGCVKRHSAPLQHHAGGANLSSSALARNTATTRRPNTKAVCVCVPSSAWSGGPRGRKRRSGHKRRSRVAQSPPPYHLPRTLISDREARRRGEHAQSILWGGVPWLLHVSYSVHE